MAESIRTRTKITYALDGANRLVIQEPVGSLGQLRLIRTVEGTLTTDRSNRLIYRTDAASEIDGRPGPQAIHLDGTWTLTPDRRLAVVLRESERSARRTLYIHGAIIEAQANTLVVALRRSENEDLHASQRLTLSGRWAADAKNRLTFLVEKADGVEDRLTLQGGWDVGPGHELLYRYRQRTTQGRLGDERTVIFQGAWEMTQADRLVYRLEGSADSAFEFKVALQSPSLLARDGRIVYQVGMGLAGGRLQRRRVSLFGAWKLHRDLSVSFEIPYADGRVSAMRFEGTAALSARDRIAVTLYDSRRRRLGLAVTFTRELVPDASLFLRLRHDAEETAAIGGVQVRF